MARPRKNTASLEGDYGKDKMKERLELEKKLKGNNDKIFPPKFILLDEVAAKKFEQLTKELIEIDLINNVDVDMLAVYCDTWSKYVRATTFLMAQPLVDEGGESKSGAIIKTANPYVKIQQSYAQQLMKISSLFGLSPADRSRIAHVSSDKEEKEDPMVALMEKLKK